MRSAEDGGGADLVQQEGYRSGLWIGSYGQNHGVFHHDFSSQIERAQNWEWDDVVHVDSQQPTTWATHWNSQ